MNYHPKPAGWSVHQCSEAEISKCEHHMRLAIEAAEISLIQNQQLGVGGVLVRDGEVLATVTDRSGRGAAGGHPLLHTSMLAVEAMAELHRTKSSDLPDQYLCNGADLFLTREPCVMCTMALIHSRIRRVFFALTEPQFGGICSVASLHYAPTLNHHFTAVEGLCAAECAARLTNSTRLESQQQHCNRTDSSADATDQ
eukprot:TRINITY_DN21487_c0_g1_i1.p1 TRINITY_DN21487_c0_g1~~TRINITY_DN21487_c0_g1_i1.p1  ORF type:complete len:198 (+),score=21.32 TRINITY_DN21487_c0_g1_i1:202-795(+)